MSPDMAGFGFGFENRPVRGPGLQKYGNTCIPVFPKPSRRALAPGFGALENQPEASAKSARQTGHKTRFRPTQNTPINNTGIPVFPYFRNHQKRFKTSHSGQRTSSKKRVCQKYGNTGIPVFPKPRPATVPELTPPDQIRKNDTPPIEQKHASTLSQHARHEFYHPTLGNRT